MKIPGISEASEILKKADSGDFSFLTYNIYNFYFAIVVTSDQKTFSEFGTLETGENGIWYYNLGMFGSREDAELPHFDSSKLHAICKFYGDGSVNDEECDVDNKPTMFIYIPVK